MILKLLSCGVPKPQIVDILLADGASAFEVAKMSAAPGTKPASIRRSSRRIQERLLSYPFIELVKNQFSIALFEGETDLSLNTNNKQSTDSFRERENEYYELEVTTETKSKTQENGPREYIESLQDKRVREDKEVSWTSEMESDAQYMVRLLAGKIGAPDPEEAVNLILVLREQMHTYQPRLIRRTIEQAAVANIRESVTGYVRRVVEMKLRTNAIAVRMELSTFPLRSSGEKQMDSSLASTEQTAKRKLSGDIFKAFTTYYKELFVMAFQTAYPTSPTHEHKLIKDPEVYKWDLFIEKDEGGEYLLIEDWNEHPSEFVFQQRWNRQYRCQAILRTCLKLGLPMKTKVRPIKNAPTKEVSVGGDVVNQ